MHPYGCRTKILYAFLLLSPKRATFLATLITFLLISKILFREESVYGF